MGLFGYNAKDYSKNTELFKARLTEMMYEVSGYEGVGAALNRTIMSLKDEYPKGADAKQLQGIDARIDDLITKLNRDLQQKSFGKLSAHANMILSAVTDSRNFGMEKSSPEVLNAEEKIAEYNALIRDNLDKKASIKAQMDKLQAKADKIVDDNDPELEELARQFDVLENDLFRLDDQYREYREEYNAATAVLNLLADDQFYDELPAETMAPQEFDKMIAKVSEKREKRAARRGSILESNAEYNAAKKADLRNASSASAGSSLLARRNANRQNEAGADINNATVNTGTSNSGTPAARRFGRG